MSFGNDMKMIRHKCLMSQTEFAEALGVSFATVNRWESGRSKPNFKTMKLINSFCEAHGIDFDISKQLMEEDQK
jgi:DNA-binding transcriptional regulator YiaG